ncbi:SRPBCC family protein, partial [Phenylobacterium sp.]|uniref:SRPBCC family protein n=1 Tax=Phenylobacterium sp. TaxID=1871053 RepID=UPI00286C3063
MKMFLAAATLGALALSAGAAAAADFVTVPLEATINAPADVAWKKISGFCQIGPWFKTTCVITSGKDGEMGAVRRIADRVDEVLVAQTAWSYTYSQPKSPIDYHGTVEIRPVDKRHA